MLASALLQFVPNTEATFDPMLLLHMSYIDTFLSNCEPLIWVEEALYLVGFIVTACKQNHFTATRSFLSVLNGP